MVLRLAVPFLLGSAILAPAGANELLMPPGLDPRSFQRFVDTATYGDTVVVPPGDYKQVVMRSGITLRSEKGAEETILGTVNANEVDSLTVVDGFHLKGKGRPTALVFAEKSHVIIRNCIIDGGWAGVRVEYGDVQIEGCEISDCDNGAWYFESNGTIRDCTIRGCVKGVALTSSSPRIIRNEIRGNSVGILVKDHSEPSIGGSTVFANRIYGNPSADIRNESYLKVDAYRTWTEKSVPAPYNFWGSDCPAEDQFFGVVEIRPWLDASGQNVIDECPGEADGAPR